MALTSKSPYHPEWPERFQADKELIASAFGDELQAIHHVGSTAVPGLAAKPEIDVLIEVSEHRSETAQDLVLLRFGYVRGSDLSQGHHFYRRNVGEVRTHKNPRLQMWSYFNNPYAHIQRFAQERFLHSKALSSAKA